LQVFTGTIQDVEHGFDRKRGGRRMWIHGHGMNAESAIKQPFTDHQGNGAEPGQQQGQPIPFQAMAQQVAANGGAVAAVGPSLMGVIKDYWSQNNESPLEWFSRHEEELGAEMRVESGNIFVIGRSSDFQKGNVVAKWGDNLISWRVHPKVSRTTWGGAIQSFFDTQKAQWKDTGGGGAGDAMYRLPFPAPNSQAAQQQVDGAEAAQAESGSYGHIIINGEPAAQWQGTVTLIGARPGVDGTYTIKAAEHLYSRQGYVTNLEVKVLDTSEEASPLFRAPEEPVPFLNNPFARQPMPAS
jgi:hypothetical protein